MNLELASELIKRPELAFAANWWAKTLMSQFLNDAGDWQINAVANWTGSVLDKPRPEQAERFRTALICLMAARFAETWRENEPGWASYYRTVGTDYHPDAILSAALDFAGVTGGSLTLPIKTLMWVNPGSVIVRPGYHGKEIALMGELLHL